MKNPFLVPELCAVIAAGDFKAHQAFHDATHAATTAQVISALWPSQACVGLRQAELWLCAEFFRHLDEDLRIVAVGTLTADGTARLMADMPPDDRTDPFKRISRQPPCRVEGRAAP